MTDYVPCWRHRKLLSDVIRCFFVEETSRNKLTALVLGLDLFAHDRQIRHELGPLAVLPLLLVACSADDRLLSSQSSPLTRPGYQSAGPAAALVKDLDP